MYTNPILPGFNPDPSIIRVGRDFFLVTSTFEYTPGAPIYHSTDLIKWTLIGHALTRPSQLQIQTPEPGGGIWATTLRYHDGVYYILAASFTRYRPQDDDRVWPRGFYVKTTDIWDEKSWSDPVYFDQVGFDQDLFWDDDGKVYLSSTYRKINRTPGKPIKDFAIHISTVDLATGTATSAPRLIRESASGVAEGSHIFKRGKFYYLFTAEGGTESGHSEWVCRSEVGPFGPWEVGPANPLWRNGVLDEVQNTGHADLVEDVEGRWWAVFLGVRPVRRGDYWEDSVFGRETFLAPLEWQNNWPIINSGQKITLQNTTPALLYQYSPPIPWRDDFKAPTLQRGWYRKNTPQKKDYTLLPTQTHQGTDTDTNTNTGTLRLHGGPYTLSSPASPTLFLRKQTHRFCTWETRLSFRPESIHAEAGTAVYLNYFMYASIGVRLEPSSHHPSPSPSIRGEGGETDTPGGKRVIRFTPRNLGAGYGVVEYPLRSATSDVVFWIECGDEYRFWFREVAAVKGEQQEEQQEEGDGDRVCVGTVSNKSLVEAPLPVGALFTGAMFGVYSVGDREAVLVPADFRYAEVKQREGYEG
ncbi:glycoside hydrolase family 43 protein [Aspergillus lucknowensis]|uniref:Glycosyl hydrolase n=1 Tax=Aspergillus lucknowensis TaxID=176173 RepID=A0ABR4LV65_9EURO